MTDYGVFTQKTWSHAMACAMSLESASHEVGGVTPAMSMTLGDFIANYGRNGVIFSISEDKRNEIQDSDRTQEAK